MLTITEALAEVNLLKKKIADSEMSVRTMLLRAEHVPDPFKEHGGAEAIVKKTQQSVFDMRRRLVDIRHKISKANIDNQITINGKTMSIFDWLTWKREVYPGLESSLKTQLNDLQAAAKRETDAPQSWKDNDGKIHLVVWLRNVDQKILQDEYNDLVETFGRLDGQLSLKNATINLN